MTKPPKADLTEAKRIAARLLAMPPKTHDEMKLGRKAKPKAGKSPAKRTSGKGRARVGKSKR